MLAKMRLFQKAATGVLIIFMGLMILVTVVAYARPSGATRQDMAKAQLIRQRALHRNAAIESLAELEPISDNAP